jgi:hypothetical protein
MKSVRLQFHATRPDIYSIALRWFEENSLTLVGEIFFPEYRLSVLPVSDWRDGQDPGFEVVNRVSLHRDAVDIEVTSDIEYFRKNPNCLTILIGRSRDGSLYESILSARTDDMDSLKLWRRLKGQAKRSLSKGVWIINDLNGARVRDDGHSYSSGAGNYRMLAW